MLEFSAVSYSIKKKEILHDISFSVTPGRIVALLGKNGSGKTTLLRAVNREIAYRGSITLDNTPIEALGARERALRAAYLPQTLRAPKMMVKDLVALGRMPHKAPLSRLSDADRAAVLRAMEATDTLALAECPADRLSGGERQRVYLAMALAQEAPLLLLDEPTTYLDTDARKGLLSLVSTLVRNEKKAALCVLHDINDAIRLADDIALLDAGHLSFFGKTDEFLEKRLPQEFFGLSAHKVENGLPFFY